MSDEGQPLEKLPLERWMDINRQQCEQAEVVEELLERLLPAKRRTNYGLVLMWLINHRALYREIDVHAKSIARANLVGCSERTVQRAIAFFRSIGILETWERWDDNGAPRPPGGRLFWGAVLRVLGREPEGAVLPTVSLDHSRRGPLIAASAASFDADPGCQGNGSAARADPRPERSQAGELVGCSRNPSRVVACVRAHRVVSALVTESVDDDGRTRTVQWPQVVEAAALVGSRVSRKVKSPPTLKSGTVHCAAWLSLAIFSRQWLEKSADGFGTAVKNGLVRGDPTAHFIGCLRNNLVSFEGLPRLSKDDERANISAMLYAIEPWVAERLAEDAARKPAPEAPQPRDLETRSPEQIRRDSIKWLRARRCRGPLNDHDSQYLERLEREETP